MSEQERALDSGADHGGISPEEGLAAIEARRDDITESTAQARAEIEADPSLQVDTPEEALARKESYAKGLPFANSREALAVAREGGKGVHITEGGIILEHGVVWVEPENPFNYAAVDLRDTEVDRAARQEAEAAGREYKNAGQAYYAAIYRRDGLYMDENRQIKPQDGLTWVGETPNYAVRPRRNYRARPVPDREVPEPTEAPEPTEVPEPTEEPEPTEVPEPTEAPEPVETIPTEARRKEFMLASIDERYPGSPVISMADGIVFDYIPPGKKESEAVECRLTSTSLMVGDKEMTIRNNEQLKLWAEVPAVKESQDVFKIGGAQIDKVKKTSTGFAIESILLTRVRFGKAVTHEAGLSWGGITYTKRSEADFLTEKRKILRKLREKGVLCPEVQNIESDNIPNSLTLRVTDLTQLDTTSDGIQSLSLFTVLEAGHGSLATAKATQKTVSEEKVAHGALDAYVYSEGTYSMEVIA